MAGGDNFDIDLAHAADELDRLVRRLRSLSPRALQERREYAVTALSALAVINGQLELRSLTAPAVADHVLADAIAVVGGDVLDAIAAKRDVSALDAVTRALSVTMTATR